MFGKCTEYRNKLAQADVELEIGSSVPRRRFLNRKLTISLVGANHFRTIYLRLEMSRRISEI